MRFEDLEASEQQFINDFVKSGRRKAAAYKRHHGSLRGFTKYLLKEDLAPNALYLDVDEDAGTVEYSGLTELPDNWRELDRFKGAWYNVPPIDVKEMWNEMSEEQRRIFSRRNPGKYLAAGIDISPYLTPEDIEKLS